MTCKQGELEASLRADTTLADIEVEKWDVALSAALLYLDANDVLHLARGKAVFRAAMTIELKAEARRRQFRKSDYAELALHYQDKIVQVHVMAEYARLAIGKIQAAVGFIRDYFGLERAEFVRRHFAGRKDVLELATTEEAHRRILTSLANPDQQAIVAAPPEGNHLVLAGPGAGKTRVIVHRVAWLLREAMVLPEQILVLAYNRAAANEIRRRLWALVGADAGGVAVQTLHGLAMRLTGTSYAVAVERGDAVDLDEVIRQASRRLRASDEDPDATSGASLQRDRLLCGVRFLLVDEYQDVNGDHYELIGAVAGRMLASEADRVSLMVVGDDDQNIYEFDGASVQYIRRFEADYAARRYLLVENYRSTAHIVDCANRLIDGARERMKAGQPIRVDHARRDQPAGGEMAQRDRLARGQVQVLEVPADALAEARIALGELERLHALCDGGAACPWGCFAVIARRWEDLQPIASACRQQGIPALLLRDASQVHLHLTRDGDALLAQLQGRHRRARSKRVLLRAGTLARWFRRRFEAPVDAFVEHPSRAALAHFVRSVEAAAPGCQRVVDELVESLCDFGGIVPSGDDERPDSPMLLMTAHRAKGLEFDHVLIADGDGWRGRREDERRLFYVAMTRARKSLTICAAIGRRHPFVADLDGLVLRSRPQRPPAEPRLAHRFWCADPEKVVLSWPGRSAPSAPIHRALAALDVGSPLVLRPRQDGTAGWEMADGHGVAVTRMSSKFRPPAGRIVGARVALILVRHAGQDERRGLRCPSWELVLPEIEYIP